MGFRGWGGVRGWGGWGLGGGVGGVWGVGWVGFVGWAEIQSKCRIHLQVEVDHVHCNEHM